MEILPAGKACGTSSPLYHIKENGKVIGTITVLFRDLIRVYWIDETINNPFSGGPESWHDDFGEVCQMIESPKPQPAPRGWEFVEGNALQA